MYTSDEYEAVATWVADLLDRLTRELPLDREAALSDVFMLSQRYEYLFWEMAYRMEAWPV